MENVYLFYSEIALGIQDKSWTPHIVCRCRQLKTVDQEKKEKEDSISYSNIWRELKKTH